jgi:hypothetical protein
VERTLLSAAFGVEVVIDLITIGNQNPIPHKAKVKIQIKVKLQNQD